MFCSRCGQEISEDMKFCPRCGAPAEAPEPETAGQAPENVPENVPVPEAAVPEPEKVPEPPQGPAAEAESPAAAPVQEPVTAIATAENTDVKQAPILTGKKGGRSIAVIAALAVVAVALVIGLVKLLPALFGGGGKEVYVYSTDDNELMFRKDLKAKTEATELSDESAEVVRFSEDGKYIYFFEGDAFDSYADLYMIRTADAGRKNASPEKLSSDVSTSDLTVLDAGGLLYLKGDSSDSDLYYYDGKESNRVARDVEDYTIDGSQSFVYYGEWDDSDDTVTLYRINFKKGGDRETLLKNVDTIYSSYDAEVLVYGMSDGDGTYDVYSKKPDGDKEKIASEVFEVEDVRVSKGKADVLYTTRQSEDVTLYDFVTDRYADSDRSARKPETSEYQTYVQGYWYGYYTTDWDAYNRAMDQWRPVEQRNNIRTALQDESYSVEYYTLNLSSGGDVRTIADRITAVRCDMDAAIYLYQKYEGKVEPVADVSELDSAWDIYDRIDNGSSTWYQNVGGTESEFELDEDYTGLNDIYVLGGSEAVLSVNDDDFNTFLLSYSIGKSGLSYQTEITDKYQGLSFRRDAKGKDVLYYFTDVNRDGDAGDLIRYDGSKATVAKEANSVIVLDDGTVFSTEDQRYNSRRNRSEYTLCLVDKDGRGTRIADDVSARFIVDAKKVLYISDGDLFVWNGKDSERLARDVNRIWASKRADASFYWCR